MIKHYTFFILSVLAHVAYSQVTFIAPTKSVVKGDAFTVDIRVKSRDSISALQFTLEWTPSVLAFQAIDTVVLPTNSMDIFGLANIQQGNLRFLWLSSAADGIVIPDSSVIFRLKFKAVGDKGASSSIKFTNSVIRIKALNPRIETLSTTVRDGQITIDLANDLKNIKTPSSGVILYQNIPNPVSQTTMIPFELKEAEQVSFEIYDTLGRTIYHKEAYFGAGKQQMEIDTEGVLQRGFYVYGLRTRKEFITRTMIKI